MKIKPFQKKVWNFYRQHKRNLPWRQGINPYRIMVSEVMLQQTQVSRVIVKYAEFLKVFPTVSALAAASLRDVLGVWSGLGYNRRAKFLHSAAVAIAVKQGVFPKTAVDWQNLPGIGKHTAGAIMVYAYNKPAVFIETNIRTVFLHEFFPEHNNVSDDELYPLIEQSMDLDNPREWYWALMDYGSYLKSIVVNPSRRSKHYSTQSKFTGSNRQLRGQVIKRLLVAPAALSVLQKELQDERLTGVLRQLANEQIITKYRNVFRIK